MKAILAPILLLCCQVTILSAQHAFSYGLGYFGENITHPGITLQVEYSSTSDAKFKVPLRANLGGYLHKRSNNAAFFEIGTGLRFKPKTHFYMGFGGGVGLIASWYDSDLGVFEVDFEGNITEASNFGGIDFMPSVNFDFGYIFTGNDNTQGTLWARPKAFWQYPSNERFLFHYALEIGYSIRFIK